MKEKTKTALIISAVAALLLVCAVSIVLCVISLTASRDTADVTLYDTYLEMVEAGEFEGTYADWLAEYVVSDASAWQGSGTDLSAAASAALLSSVSVEASATYTYSSRSAGMGPGGGSTTYETESSWYGSGVLIDVDRDSGDAYFVTNGYVGYDGTIYSGSTAYTPSETSYTAYLYGMESEEYAMECSVLGYSVTCDVAVCKIEGSEIIQNSCAAAATAGDSDALAAGDPVVLAGNALDEGLSVTAGIVSVTRETYEATAVDGSTSLSVGVIRTDAAGYAGCYGGGLFDADGVLVGMFTDYESEGGEDMSYCLPANTVLAVADSIMDSCDGTTKTTSKFTLGVMVTSGDAEQVYDGSVVTTEEAQTVYSVTSGSAAAEAGIEAEDVILSLTDSDGNAKKAAHSWCISDFLWTVRAGDVFTVTVERDGEELDLQVTADESSFSSVS